MGTARVMHFAGPSQSPEIVSPRSATAAHESPTAHPGEASWRTTPAARRLLWTAFVMISRALAFAATAAAFLVLDTSVNPPGADGGGTRGADAGVEAHRATGTVGPLPSEHVRRQPKTTAVKSSHDGGMGTRAADGGAGNGTEY